MRRRGASVKVAVVEPVGGHGGMHLYDYGMCMGLQAAGIDAVLYTCDETRQEGPRGIVVRRTFRRIYGPLPLAVRGAFYWIGSVATLISAVASGRRICHYHFFSCGIAELFSVVMARIACRKVVITLHDVTTLSAREQATSYGRILCRLASVIIVHNEISRDELIRHYGLSPSGLRTIPHGNYLPFCLPMTPQADAKRQLSMSADSEVLLFIGQIKEAKGLDILVKAMPHILSRHPRAMLLIAGRPWKVSFSVYDDMIRDLGITSRCKILLKYLDDREMAMLFSAASLIVLPYKRIYQSGIALMAMSYGKAIVASDIPGLVVSVDNGETGWTFASSRPDDLARVINDALDRPNGIERIGGNARRKVERENDWFSIGSMLKDVYEKLS